MCERESKKERQKERVEANCGFLSVLIAYMIVCAHNRVILSHIEKLVKRCHFETLIWCEIQLPTQSFIT